MKKKIQGQITMEAAIVIPIVLMMVVGLIGMVLYSHDALAITAYVYGTANDHINEGMEILQKSLEENINRVPLFIIRPEIETEKKTDSICIRIQGKSKSSLNWMDKLVSESYHPDAITIEQNMSDEIIYISQTILNQMEKKEA